VDLIDIEVCDICGKKVKVIACIEDMTVIKKILALKRVLRIEVE
jgi:hypothetical protein